MLEITCPDCGYNLYLVKDLLNNEETEVSVSKCDFGGCDLTVKGEDSSHYEDFDELSDYFNTRFEIIDLLENNCVN